jgi:type IV secretory pathway TraG/TraD family ATPase VirD4
MSDQKETRLMIMLAVIGGVALVIFGLHGAAVWITQLTCGIPLSGPFLAGVGVLITGDPSGYTTGTTSCAVPTTLIRTVDIIGLVLLLAGVATLAVWWHRYRQSDVWFISNIRRRPGFAKGGEIAKHLSAKAITKRAAVLRPNLSNPKPSDAGWKVGRSENQDVYVSIEDSVVLEGPPRSGKGYRLLISAILDWSGPLVTTSTRNDNVSATYAMRKKRGEVTVFDPQGLAGARSTLRISPIRGCEDPLTADQRAQSIIGGTAMGSSKNNQEWSEAASGVFAQLLHAAAIAGSDVSDLYRWGASPNAAIEAVDILKSDGTPGWGDALQAVVEGDPKRRDNTWFGVSSAVRPLAIPAIQESLRPRPGEEFDAEAFLAGENTLYLIGTSAGAGSMGGFLGAVLDDVVSAARRKANASRSTRLDPPLGLVLDEIANMFYWKQLPIVMADGGGIGVSPLVVLQALSQAETAWSKAEMDTIWSAATAKLTLGGASDVSHLRDIAALMGERNVRQKSYSRSDSGSSTNEQTASEPLMSVDEIRRMPETMGLLAYRNRRPVLLNLTGWTERSDAKEIQAGKRSTEADAQLVFAERLNPPSEPTA